MLPWTDNVKLRYGKRRDDNPWLWDLMAKYTADSAELFHAFRITKAQARAHKLSRRYHS